MKIFDKGLLLGGVYMWKLAPVRVWSRYDIVISYRVYMKGHFMSTNVIVTPIWIGYWRLRMRFPFQTPGKVISCWSERPYRVYMTSECVFVPEWKSRSGTVTGMNSHRYDSLHYEILCWCHINEYRATRGNWSELVPEWKSRRYHVNTPLVATSLKWLICNKHNLNDWKLCLVLQPKRIRLIINSAVTSD